MKALLAVAVMAGVAHADTKGWDVKLADRAAVEVGATTPLSLAIAVDRGLTVSKDGPVIVDIAADEGVTIKKKRLARSDAVDPEADAPRFAINVRGDAAGDRAVKVRVRFWLCAQRTCRPVEATKTAVVAVSLGEK